ncbi:MAG TPA: aminodeoxychorismate/anthranilate synthase component II [Ktedonobacterales bacterium]|jgi:anthranilate synthase/aminodeoxychorismate synthase-like glutamine amidotransferase
MLLLIDNYDSFTFNLYQALSALGAAVEVRRNDTISLAEAEALAPSHIVISPGPGTPADAGVSLALIERLGRHTPVLGVCLGHQCIGAAFGGRVVRAPLPVHGKSSAIHHSGAGVLRGLPTPFEAGRYHSLIVARDELPPALEATAETSDRLIMGLRHREYPLYGVQFHPESILTPLGEQVLRNFLAEGRREPAPAAAAAVGRQR